MALNLRRRKVVFMDKVFVGYGPDGRGKRIEPGAYLVINDPSVNPEMYPLEDPEQPGELYGYVPERMVSRVVQVLPLGHEVAWARFYRETNRFYDYREEAGMHPNGTYEA